MFPRKSGQCRLLPPAPSHLCVYRHGCVYIAQIRLGFGLNSVENGQIASFFLFLNFIFKPQIGGIISRIPGTSSFAAPEGLMEKAMMAVQTEYWKSCTMPQNPLENTPDGWVWSG